MLYDEEYSRKVYPFLTEEFFDGSKKILFNVYKELYDKYNTVPTLEAIAITLQAKSIGDSDFSEILELVEEVSTTKADLPNTQWLIDETETYCRDKAIYNSIYQSIAILDGSEKKLDKFAIPEMLEKAISISFDTNIGSDYFEDAERRFELYTNDDNRIILPLHALMNLSNGGLRLKSLVAILGGTNVGKTAVMCYLAGELIKHGYNVLYVSMEMAEEWIGQRIDANILDIKTEDLEKLSKDEFLSKIRKVKEKVLGKLIVKEYPTSSAHAGHFRHLLNELKQKRKFVPHVVFVDYINICASSRYRSLSGVNSYSYVKAIAEELRGLAVETNTCFFTGTQLNRSGMKSSSPDMTDTSDSVGVPFSLDWFIALHSDEVLLQNNQILIQLLKTRWGNKAKIQAQLVNIDYDKMRLSDVSSDSSLKLKVGQNKPEFHKNEQKAEKVSSIQWD